MVAIVAALRVATISASRSPASTIMYGILVIFCFMSMDMSGHTEAKCCMWGGRDGAEAMGEGGPCPRKRPAPGPEAARMASVAIGDVAVESMYVEV